MTRLAHSSAHESMTELARENPHRNDGRRPFAAPLLTGVVGLLLVLLVGLLVANSVSWTSGELAVDKAVNGAYNPFFDGLALFVNVLFSPPVAAIIVVVVTVLIVLTTRRLRTAAEFAVIVTGSWLGSEVVKWIVQRPRPDHAALMHPLITETSFSYPSGHTAFAASLGLGLIVLAGGRRWRPALIVVVAIGAVVVAWSRVYLGVHYPSDVAASLLYSTSAVLVITALWNRFVAPRFRR